MLNPDEILEKIEGCINELDRVSKTYKTKAQEAGAASATFDVAFAQARLDAKANRSEDMPRVTDDTAKDIATVQTEDLRIAKESANAIADAYKQRLFAVRDSQNGWQSILRFLKELG